MTLGLWFAWLFNWATPMGGLLPEVAENRWVFEGEARLRKEGLFSEYPTHSRRKQGAYRFEMAVLLHAIMTNHLNLLTRAPESVGDRTRSMLLRSDDLTAFYRRATLEFAPELLALGVTDEPNIELIKPLTERLRQWSPRRLLPFSDVPSNHWAAKAVGDLRALGMLDGYPDGRYRG